jgi:hypothetical protein
MPGLTVKFSEQMLTPHALHVECYAEAHYDGIASSTWRAKHRSQRTVKGLETQMTHHQLW